LRANFFVFMIVFVTCLQGAGIQTLDRQWERWAFVSPFYWIHSLLGDYYTKLRRNGGGGRMREIESL